MKTIEMTTNQNYKKSITNKAIAELEAQYGDDLEY